MVFPKLLIAQQLTSVGLKDVTLADGFWKQKLDVNRTVTVWHNFKMCEDTGRIANFAKAAGLQTGKHEGAFFNDSDVYKVIEGASYILAQHPDDAKLDKYLDGLIATIAKAQQPDGYLYTFYELGDMSKKFTNLKDMHEFYCAGHLIEAGVAHFQATGKRSLLEVGIKYADLLDKTFGENKRHDVCGHEEIELALFKLADATREQKYAKLATYFVHQRGRDDGRKLFGIYHQDDRPLESCDEVVGHAVRQMYFLCAATDATAHGDQTFLPAMDRMWHDLVDRKMYITGGVGARHDGEAFGAPYELPNESAYAETCAAIGSALWNERMNLLTGDAKYADVVETASYNGILSGVSLAGDKFFYVNPLASKGDHHRESWYDCACCPPNVVRFFASLPARIYATRYDLKEEVDTVYVNQFASSTASLAFPDGKVRLTQETNYPWDSQIRLKINLDPARPLTLWVRIPQWCKHATAKVNGTVIDPLSVENGYARVDGTWHDGDELTLQLSMPIERVHADPRVKDDAGKVAIARGPIVYCAEAADNGGAATAQSLPPDEELKADHAADLLGGVDVIKGKSIMLVPYYAWDNRTAGKMAVWLNESN